MILAISDDFTGAAELGGIGLRYGLNVEVQTDFICESKTDLLIIDSNTRCLSENEAAVKIKSIAEKIKNVECEWIFKKTDSVLRGHVLTEIRSLIGSLKKQHAILIPANPGMGRTISDGTYYIKGIPLHQTEFSMDPEFPRMVSDVLKLLDNKQQTDIQVLKNSDASQIRDITIGEVMSIDDINSWTARLGPDIIPAGGSEFFTAILNSKGYATNIMKAEIRAEYGNNSLMVCGSTSRQTSKFIKRLDQSIACVCEIPCKVTDLSENCIKKWLDDIEKSYQRSNFVVVVINHMNKRVSNYTSLLSDVLARMTKELIQKVPISDLIIEGGDTASAIIRMLGWTRLIPKIEWGLGGVSLCIRENPNILLTTKPGSYKWPKMLLQRWKID